MSINDESFEMLLDAIKLLEKEDLNDDSVEDAIINLIDRFRKDLNGDQIKTLENMFPYARRRQEKLSSIVFY